MVRRQRTFLLALILLVCSPVVLLAMLSFFSRKPDNLGVVDGRLADCPRTPNCVCTQDRDPQHAMEPLHFQGTPSEAMERLAAVIAALPGAKIVTTDDQYMHVEVTSGLFRFVDDVEFLIEPDTKTVHFRSASRVGQTDLGVNRQRMQTIHQKFNEQ